MAWFEKSYESDLEPYKKSVEFFNKLAGKAYDPESQLRLCREEAEEILEAYNEEDKAAFLKEVCDLFVVSCVGMDLPSPLMNSLDTVVNSLALPLNQQESLEIAVDILNVIDADIKGALTDVCSSNMSKFSPYDPKSLDAYDAHCHTLMESGRYTGVNWELREGLVIWKDDNNKILKGLNYREADVSRFVN